ncbi:MAG: hypothetical protein M1818_005661 [Claussenomyces sp. TS43310]|nr:MAG: hypothetical protein M1818_005661 [Claussenomyces sp. TS43310]
MLELAAVECNDILLLSLAFQNFLDDTYSSLIDSLGKSAPLKRAKTSNGAAQYLEANYPKAILVTDQGLTETKHGGVLEKVQSYIQDGGLVIFGLHFPSYISKDNFDKFFSESFGLPWKRGDYHRTTFQFNPSCTLPASVEKASPPSAYSMQVLHVSDARQHEKIFIPVAGATTQSHVFSPSYVDETQAAVVGAKVGDGFLVYAGDVNAELGSDKIILALCGL